MPEDSLDPCDSALGKFDPDDARRLMELLRENGISFELEIEAKPKWGNAHVGTWIAIFVSADQLQEGNRLARTLFPAESPPPQ